MRERPLTRRELRELERLARPPLDVADALAAHAAPADAAPGPVAVELTPAAALLVAAELNEPDLVPAALVESDRAIAAPPVDEVLVTAFELLMTDVPTTTTEIGLPSRAQLRAREKADRGTRGRTPRGTPRRVAAPASPPASSAPPSRPAGDRMRRLTAKGVTVAAMAFAAMMAVSTSLPAEALLSSADVQAAAYEARTSTKSEPAQSLELASGTGTITVLRDGYEAQTIAEFAAASGIRMEATFTNNPNGTIQWPFAVGVHIGDRFGPRNCAGCSANHGGQDFNPGLGAPIQAIADGVVSYAQDGEGSLGVHMIIDHMIDGELVSSVYAHMIHGSMLFAEGDVIKVGQIIGKTGSTGMSTGPHLHFDIRLGGRNGTKVDPLIWLYANTN